MLSNSWKFDTLNHANVLSSEIFFKETYLVSERLFLISLRHIHTSFTQNKNWYKTCFPPNG